MLKILHLDTGTALRGGQHQILGLARGLRQRGHVQLIGCPAGSRLEGLAREEGLDACGLRFHGHSALGSVAALRGIIRSRGFDVIHAHDGRGQTLAWLASAGQRVRRVASRRVTFLPRRRALHRLKYSLTCDRVIAVSQFVRQLLVDAGIPASKIEVIPDGVDIPAAAPNAASRAQARKNFGLAGGDFVIGQAGAFTPEKGQEVALQAFKLIAEHIPCARLLLAGEGSELAQLARKYQLGDGAGPVRLLGYLDDLGPFMDSLDLFLMPSLAEGLGSSTLIAMAHGVPVIASRTGGLPEIIADGENGWLVQPGSAEELAGAIVSAAAHPDEMSNAGLRGREKARLFTNDIIVGKTEALYRRLFIA